MLNLLCVRSNFSFDSTFSRVTFIPSGSLSKPSKAIFTTSFIVSCALKITLFGLFSSTVNLIVFVSNFKESSLVFISTVYSPTGRTVIKSLWKLTPVSFPLSSFIGDSYTLV